MNNRIEVNLPDKFDLVVGDTFELFYRGIIKVKNVEMHYICVDCDIGHAYNRKFSVLPIEENIGSHEFTVRVLDDYGNEVGFGKTLLEVKTPLIAPEKPMNVLCIGDSLTTGGWWVDEFCRRLTKTGRGGYGDENTPEGYGLENINFIGKKTSGKTCAGYEGFGGWSFASYLATANGGTAYWLTVSSHSKTDADQESIYKDDKGNEWQLETIEEKRLLFKKYSGNGVLPLSGTLVWSNGGSNREEIEYISQVLDSNNPFCYDSKVDFDAYCRDIGASGIDASYILLGWNNSFTPEDDYKKYARKFLDILYEFNPKCQVTLLGIQMPSIDGMATSYGANGHWTLHTIQGYVFALNRWYEDMVKEYNEKGFDMSFINIAGQFDSDNGFPTAKGFVNTRLGTEWEHQCNGVHPCVEGYLQIADAAFRHFNNKNQE